ncbi:trypsin-1-like [Choristoneura fumiferana]|uniref:trypsin-1-like n=1 Tax=Choristoneura fumiferana TaxID=7141 RepID=UPI003D155E06
MLRGLVQFASVGSLKRPNNVEAGQVYQIKRIIRHPDYHMIQNDIALLETDSIHLSQSIVPACLDVFGGDRDRAVATGWGRTTHRGGPADTLQKVTLTKFTDTECRAGLYRRLLQQHGTCLLRRLQQQRWTLLG